MLIEVKVTPKAKENKVLGMENGVLKVRVTAAPENNKANLALIALLSEYYRVPKRSVIIQSGETSRLKKVLIDAPIPS